MTAPALRPLAIDVVSVQSQVVYGRVGNNVAVPTLQAQGLAVAAVPTVVLSNTPHYPTIHGGALPVDWFAGYLSDLSARGALGQLRAVLTGYLGGPEQAQALGRWIGELVHTRPALRVVIDPVLGDEDHGEYVAPGMADAYRQHLLPLADGLTPNGFELARLTGMPVGSFDQVVAAARTLLADRTQWIAVTSAAPATWAPGEMQVALVTRTQAEAIRHPRIAATPKGTGDLFCAGLTARWLGGAELRQAAEAACQQVVEALELTRQAQSAELLLPST
ncbi:MAG: pyridoxine/pyridoxal/pyridoxamine kinase [Burkholderiales bacterium]|nr:pyridoxine/pyridoxal/pyridoxamine kinase [Burkholderiales bacterium]MBS0401698.1 pyridoxine/pyridoxal/pyridoxamine kinase [Pseudomonadota bacterium]